VCVDAGGTLGPVNIVADLVSYQYNPYTQSLVSTNVAECMRQHLTECVEFIADLHTINKVKVMLGQVSCYIYCCSPQASKIVHWYSPEVVPREIFRRPQGLK